MVELDTVLGTEDMYDLLEIISVDMYNQYVVNKASQPKNNPLDLNQLLVLYFAHRGFYRLSSAQPTPTP